MPFLEGLGHSVMAIDLPGRNGKGRPGWRLTLQDYIDDLSGTVDREQGKVILVGHSLGGMSISGVAEKLPHKVARLVYVTAWVPMDGKNLVQLGRENEASGLHRGTGSSLLRGVITAHMTAFREVCSANIGSERN